ncbi:MAG: DUF3800 domain-containing protein [Corallococcus sp.]|nr:DUF3800 domain-containing protein [Corallococcus sp.]
MVSIFIDESGSMTTEYTEYSPYFLIALVIPQSARALKTTYKRFVHQHLDELKKLDKNNKMFLNGKFKELKGSEFSPDLKRQFVEYFCRDNQLQIYYIVLDNKAIDKKFYKNTARAFNYSVKVALIHLIGHNYISNDEDIIIQIDERNQRTDAKAVLQEYLNTELSLEEDLCHKDIEVQYFDSCNNHLIQVADVFANLYYSELRTGNYSNEFDMMKKQGYLKKIFVFPKTDRKNGKKIILPK